MEDKPEEIVKQPSKLRKNGFDYTLVLRTGDRAIYCQHVSNTCQYFEVMKIQTRPAGLFNGKPFPAREIFPMNESFRRTAWTHRTYAKALIEFNTLK